MLKKKLAAFLAAVLAVSGCTQFTAAAFQIKIGDVNADGIIDSADSLFTLRASVGLEKITDEQFVYADINNDGIVDSYDSLSILRLSVVTPGNSSVLESPFLLSQAVNGIDVSFWQEEIDFEKVKDSGIDFVIIRAGGATDNPAENHYGIDSRRQGVDARFEENYAKAKAAGLNVGVYWYSFAENVEQAKKEAESCLRAIKGKQLEYPIFYDLENMYQFNKGVDFCSSLMEAFCGTIRDNGYYSAFYMSTYFATNYLDDYIKSTYDCWLAQWSGEVNYVGKYVMWQYSTGKVNGINGDVDVDISYVNYPMYIKFLGLNGWE